ncbi:response regulator transcription factor [Candidatus Poribacteria bacterium]|nr:response regulator transcription factor [Candidatus Poribacteria bacterium]
MASYHIVLADDHAIFRHGLRRILAEDADLEVIGEAKDGLELLTLLNKLSPDLVILDISMPNLGGIEAIHRIKAMRPDVKILMLTMYDRKEYLYEAITAGADGFSLKQGADKDLFNAIAAIRQGNTYVSPLLSKIVQESLFEALRGRKTGESSSLLLTQREKEILKLVAEGRSSREVADLLFISDRTVDWHRANIMKKLGLKNTAELVKYAMNAEFA